jgi:hypothetical protein
MNDSLAGDWEGAVFLSLFPSGNPFNQDRSLTVAARPENATPAVDALSFAVSPDIPIFRNDCPDLQNQHL